MPSFNGAADEFKLLLNNICTIGFMDCFLTPSLAEDEAVLDVGDEVEESEELAFSIVIIFELDSVGGFALGCEEELDGRVDDAHAPTEFELKNKSCESNCFGASVELEIKPVVAGVE